MSGIPKVAIVTGSSSGIGYAVCQQLLEKSYTVYGFSRRGLAPDGVYAMSVDISDKAAVEKAVGEIFHKEGKIDILAANAGMGISGPVETASAEDVRRQMDVNFFGQVYSVQAVLPVMRQQNEGHIIFTSSVAAPIAIPYQGYYSASKAAVNSLALALRNEVKPFNIRVSIAQLGDCSTGFTDVRKKDETKADIYKSCRSSVEAMEKDERNGYSPEYAAKAIVNIAEKSSPAPIYTVGGKYKVFTLLFRLLPARLSYFIVEKMYS